MKLFTKTNLAKSTASVLIGITALGGAAAIVPTFASAQDAEVPAQSVEVPAQADDSADQTRAEQRAERRAAKAQAMADLLGVTVDELRAEREAGQSIADIAVANGVSVQSVIDSIVAEKTARIEAKLADGTIDADRAGNKLANLEEKVTERVNSTETRGERGQRGPRGQRGGGNGTTT